MRQLHESSISETFLICMFRKSGFLRERKIVSVRLCTSVLLIFFFDRHFTRFINYGDKMRSLNMTNRRSVFASGNSALH